MDDGLITAEFNELLDELDSNLKKKINDDVKVRGGHKHEYLGMCLDFSVKN